jgi:hypothetical protein
VLIDLSNNCYKCFEQRVEDIQINLYDSNQKYNELNSEIQKIQRKLIEKAPKEVNVLFQDYTELLIISQSILVEKLYKQGVDDGIRLSNVIKDL